jgi:dolichol kinase
MQNWKASSITTSIVTEELQGEILRKTIHVLIAFVPVTAQLLGTGVVMSLLALGVLAYSTAETLRLSGGHVLLVTRVTVLAARPRDRGRFVLGPVTLGIGAMMSLMLYPDPAATIAIYALAFGDGIASIAGKLFGRIRIPLTSGKTVEGTMACLAAVFVATYSVTGRPELSATVASAAAIIELAPTEDLDNIILPVGVGFIAMQLML